MMGPRVRGLMAFGLAMLLAPSVWAQADASAGLVGILDRGGFWVALGATFLGGLALNFTPCVYPMIPVTLAFFSGQANGRPARTVRLALCYVAGIAVSYAVLGLVAAKTGSLLGAWLQHPAVLVGVALVIVGLALSMFGLYELQPPAWLLGRVGQASAGYGGAWVMGLVVGLVAAPCVGPFLLSLLVAVGQLGRAWQGFLMFLVLGLGMGLPYIFLALAADRLSQLPRSGGWLVWIKRLLGFLLLGLALWFLRPLISDAVFAGLAACLMAVAGAYLGWIDPSRSGPRLAAARWLVGLALVAGAVVMVWPKPAPPARAPWVEFSSSAFRQAQASGRPILVDTYADWCIPCVEMDHSTFRHPDVVQALSGVNAIRMDVTRGTTPDQDGFLRTYKIYGAPTILFFDAQGRERESLRILGFATPEELIKTLRQVQAPDPAS